jgi:hypothetical protein
VAATTRAENFYFDRSEYVIAVAARASFHEWLSVSGDGYIAIRVKDAVPTITV